jgi:flagellar biosynthesis protein FlhA
VREPVYGAPPAGCRPRRGSARRCRLTVVSPPEVLATHLLEVIKANFARLLTLRGLRRLLDELVQPVRPARGPRPTGG